LRAEADADTAALSNVVLPQLKAAAQKLEPLSTNVSLFIAVRELLAVESVSRTNQCTEKMLAR
jgi:hypothetical protein